MNLSPSVRALTGHKTHNFLWMVLQAAEPPNQGSEATATEQSPCSCHFHARCLSLTTAP